MSYRLFSKIYKCMAVVIRLSRHGSKKKPFYRIVAADENFPRDGRFLEILGTYDPKNKEAKGVVNTERVDFWKSKGARTSDTVAQLIKRSVA
ncbi:MAG: 30S ribosomal protein S16 [uncultured bacterium]|nr:MAG: 30S ribosomal protein S16 [uncultured bacterium]